jgi:HEAT repeat protein
MTVDQKTRETVDELLSAIEVDDSVVHEIDMLGDKGRDYLASLLDDPLSHSRRDLVHNAIYVLGQLGRKQEIPILSRLANVPDESIQMRAIHALGRLDSATAEEQAFRILEDSQYSTSVKGHTLMVLSEAINPQSVSRLQAWAEQNDVQELKRFSEQILLDQDTKLQTDLY